MSIVAIASESYCSGEEIADLVAARLGYACVGRSFYETASQKLNVSADHVHWAMSGERPLLGAFTRDYERMVTYVKSVLSNILEQKDLVYHGVAMRLIPKSITHALRVGIVGERTYRAQQAAAEGYKLGEAERLIDQSDERRAWWAQHHLGRSFWEPADYDLIIPRPVTAVADAVDIITKAMGSEFLLPTERSVQAQLDFLLASKVAVALAEHGRLRADVSTDRGNVIVKLRTRRSPPGALERAVHALRQEARVGKAYDICGAVNGVRRVEVVPTVAPAENLHV